MAKYDPIQIHLGNAHSSLIRMTFDEIAALVGGLPKSAYVHRAWWANETVGSHVHARSWQRAGYRVAELVPGDYVIFERVAGASR